jgi:uncharacterized protein
VSGGGLPPARLISKWVKARRCFTLTVGALTVFTLARIFVPLGPSAVGISALTVLLALFARWAGATRLDLGLGRRDMRSGLLYGTAAFGIAAAIENVVLFLVAVSVIPATSGFLNDTRAHISGGRLFFELAVSITLLTAIPEEFAFRGVLLWSALELTRQRRWWWWWWWWWWWCAILITSALFGLWHIAPTLHTMSDNPAYGGLTGGVAGQVLLVLGNIGVTFIGGLVFGWLRVWSKSLIAPGDGSRLGRRPRTHRRVVNGAPRQSVIRTIGGPVRESQRQPILTAANQCGVVVTFGSSPASATFRKWIALAGSPAVRASRAESRRLVRKT